ncbi:MAG: hypothetical protein IKR81_03395 [Victivallales bacterium]|nr:hypothetical protein [Victivallales bacterium]
MGKKLKACRHGLATLCLFWLAFMLLGTILTTFKLIPLLKNSITLTGFIAFVVAAFIFHKHRFTVVYVFGHELTHWATAKLFLKKTGRIRVGRLSGSTEIYNTNITITLAPYIIPFYLMVVVGLFGISQLFVYPSPLWAAYTISTLVGVTYAYHIMLNIFALRQAQSDLELYGKVFSLAFILAGNALFLLLALLIATTQWKEAFHAFTKLLIFQWDAVKAIALGLREAVHNYRG